MGRAHAGEGNENVRAGGCGRIYKDRRVSGHIGELMAPTLVIIMVIHPFNIHSLSKPTLLPFRVSGVCMSLTQLSRGKRWWLHHGQVPIIGIVRILTMNDSDYY